MQIGTVRRAERVANEPQSGTVVSRTTLSEDLIPAFAAELRRLCSVPPGIVHEAELWAQGRDAYSEGFPSVADYDLAGQEIVLDLTEALNAIAPEGLYFGAHESDAADFGWWRSE